MIYTAVYLFIFYRYNGISYLKGNDKIKLIGRLNYNEQEVRIETC